MADSKISALTNHAANPADTDLFVIVDVSDTTMAASGTNKKLAASYLATRTGTETLSGKTLTTPTIADFTKDIPLDWLRKNLELNLSPEERAKIEKMGWDELMETLKKRFEEQKERHEGGSKWIGTGGTSPFGANGFNPQGIRIGQEKSRNKSAVKVWDQRAYKDYDDTKELGTRNIKVALRRLRRAGDHAGAPVPGRLAYREPVPDPMYKKISFFCRGGEVHAIDQIERVF